METSTEHSNLISQIEIALDNIRPYLAADGGDVKILGLDADLGVLKIELLGACGSCPMSAMTLKAGIEETVRKAVPSISKVEAVNLTNPESI